MFSELAIAQKKKHVCYSAGHTASSNKMSRLRNSTHLGICWLVYKSQTHDFYSNFISVKDGSFKFERFSCEFSNPEFLIQ